MFARLLRLFKVESMIKPDLVQGELPTTKQAYKDVLQIALPSIMELVLISLINSMDTMMVGTCGDFREATYRAIRQALMRAESVLLEPVCRFEIGMPLDMLGRVRRACYHSLASHRTDFLVPGRGGHPG